MSITSKLSRVIAGLPDNFKMNKQSIANYLKKQGVKEDEIKFSKIIDNLPESNQVTKADLAKSEGYRQDQFDVIGYDDYFKNITEYSDPYNYRETVISSPYDTTFKSEHFPDLEEPYLYHSRYTNIPSDNQRIVHEIQSDLHQKAQGNYASPGDTRAMGKLAEILFEQEYSAYTPNELAKQIGNIAEFDDLGLNYKEKLFKIKSDIDYTEEMPEGLLRQTLIHNSERDLKNLVNSPDFYPDAPLKNNWMRKALERQMNDFYLNRPRDDLATIAVPIDSISSPLALENLQRSEGIQKWYETDVRNTLKKIAKEQGFDYSEGPLFQSPHIRYAKVKMNKEPKFDLYNIANMGIGAGGAAAIMAPKQAEAANLVSIANLGSKPLNTDVGKITAPNSDLAFRLGMAMNTTPVLKDLFPAVGNYLMNLGDNSLDQVANAAGDFSILPALTQMVRGKHEYVE